MKGERKVKIERKRGMWGLRDTGKEWRTRTYLLPSVESGER